ncbi:hypothetical protein D3C86_1142700 [compost metagenome]
MQAAGQRLVRCFSGRIQRNGIAQVHGPGLRRITQTGIGTALVTDLDLTARASRNFQFKALAVDLLFTEKLVAVGFAFWQRGMLPDRQSVELQAFLVQVIAVGDLPIELGFTGFQAFRGKREGFINREKFRFGVERIGSRLGQARDQESKK